MSDHLPDAAKMIAEREFLEDWLRLAGTPIGAECCGRPQRGECCGNPEPVYPPAEQVVEQMGTRHRELCAQMAPVVASELPRVAIQSATDSEALEAAYLLGRRDGMEAERARSSAEIKRLRAALTLTPSVPTDEDIAWAKQSVGGAG